MTEIVHVPHTSPFDAIRHEDHRGEWWSARELLAHFGYARWDDVKEGIARAQAAISNSLGEAAAQVNIEPGVKNVRVGFGDREIEDFRLTRYGAYMWAMNCDPRKPEIAAAQTYFAVKAREAELSPSVAGDDLDLLYGILDRLREDRRRFAALESRQAVTDAKVAAIEGAHDWFTALGFAKLHGYLTNRPYLQKVGKRATALLRLRGEEPVKRQDATFGAINTYPADVLEQAFEEVSR